MQKRDEDPIKQFTYLRVQHIYWEGVWALINYECKRFVQGTNSCMSKRRP